MSIRLLITQDLKYAIRLNFVTRIKMKKQTQNNLFHLVLGKIVSLSQNQFYASKQPTCLHCATNIPPQAFMF